MDFDGYTTFNRTAGKAIWQGGDVGTVRMLSISLWDRVILIVLNYSVEWKFNSGGSEQIIESIYK